MTRARVPKGLAFLTSHAPAADWLFVTLFDVRVCIISFSLLLLLFNNTVALVKLY